MPEPARVDFYILSAASEAARLHFACRLTEKAYLLNHRVHLHTGSSEDAARLDELLWTFRQGSFIPHELARDGQGDGPPVTIGFGPGTPPQADLLINLANAVPEFAGGFGRIAEIVDDSEPARSSGRERFRRYKQSGHEPATHNIGT